MAAFEHYVILSNTAKALGGPLPAVVKVVGVAIIAGGALYAGGQQLVTNIIVPAVKNRKADKPSPLVGQTFTVTTRGDNGHGLVFEVGDQFSVVGSDKGVIFLKVRADEGTPRYSTPEFLSQVSSFPEGGKFGS